MRVLLTETRQQVMWLVMRSILPHQIGQEPAHLVHCRAARGSFGVAEPKPIGQTAPSFPEAGSSFALLPKPYGQLALAEDCDAPASEFSEA